MSAPPIGMISRKPRPSASSAISQNTETAPPVDHEQDDQHHEQDAEAEVELVLAGERDRRALHQRLQLGERDQRAGEGDRADRQAERHLDQAFRPHMRRRYVDAERLRRVQRGGGHEHRGQADQGVEGGDQLRQGRHLDAAGEVDAADAPPIAIATMIST